MPAVSHRAAPSEPVGHGIGAERVLEIQRSRLLAAMIDACAEHGAGNVTVARVVSRAGVSRRTFYELFADREGCFLATFDDGIARASRLVLDAYDPSDSWIDRVRSALAALLAFLDSQRGLGQLLVVGSLGAGTIALERRKKVLASLIAVLDEGRAETAGASRLPPLASEGVAGGILSIVGSRLQQNESAPLVPLAGSLMSMIALPYLGAAAARRELARAAPLVPPVRGESRACAPDPLRELGMRLTYRTVRVLMAVAANPGSSNRQVADGSGIGDQGQISKLLARLHGLGLIENAGAGRVRGAPNSWVLTQAGWGVQGVVTRKVEPA